VIRITPWQLQKKILLCARLINLTPFPWCTNLLTSGVTAFFVLEFVVMTTQAFLVCEVIYPGWKQILGSFCILPRFVPISLVVSKLSRSLILPSARCSFIDLILSDGHIGRNLGRGALDGIANLTAFLVSPGYLPLTNLDL